jgi:hypothetical protein
MKTTECRAAKIEWVDSDDTDPGQLQPEITDLAWELLGDTGYVNDYGWNDVPWSIVGSRFESFEDETTIDSTELPDLPDAYEYLTIRHDDDNPENAGTSESCAWERTWVFMRSGQAS